MNPFLSHFNDLGEASMVDVGEKQPTRRCAVAGCVIRMKPETLHLLQSGQIKKGDAFTVAKTAAIFAVKKTPEVIPMCHALPIEHIEVRLSSLRKQGSSSLDSRFRRDDKVEVFIECEVSTTAKTGVEIEAIHGAMIAGLTLYDMAKSYDPAMEITEVRLHQKTGGKSDYTLESRRPDGQ